VDGLGEHLLAATGFAIKHHGRGAIGGPGGYAEAAAQGWGLGNDLVEGVLPAKILARLGRGRRFGPRGGNEVHPVTKAAVFAGEANAADQPPLVEQRKDATDGIDELALAGPVPAGLVYQCFAGEEAAQGGVDGVIADPVNLQIGLAQDLFRGQVVDEALGPVVIDKNRMDVQHLDAFGIIIQELFQEFPLGQIFQGLA